MKHTMLQRTNTQIKTSSIPSTVYQQKNIQQGLHRLVEYFRATQFTFNKYHKRDRNENDIITNI